MSRPEQSEEKLDEEFFLSLSRATTAFRRLRRHDKSLCEKWLRKLCAEPVAGQEAKKVRNYYMYNLSLQMQGNSIKPPFTSPPPVGKLKSPGDVFPREKPITKKPAWLQAILRATGTDLLHMSKDGRMYIASQNLEHGGGGMNYLPVSTVDEQPLFLEPSKITSILEVKVSDDTEESSSSLSTSSEESICEDETLEHRKKPDKRMHIKEPSVTHDKTQFKKPNLAPKIKDGVKKRPLNTRVSPDPKGSEHKVDVAVLYKHPSEKILKPRSKRPSSISEESDNSDHTLCEKLSSLQELFARRGTPNERSEVLRMFDDLIQQATKVLEGQEKPTPTLMAKLRKMAPRYSHLVNAMPVTSRILWLLTLLKEKLISQRTQFIMRMSEIKSIQTALKADCKKKLSTDTGLWQLQSKIGDVDPVWRAEVARMPTPTIMKRLKKLYHPAVVNCFLQCLIQEKINILNRYNKKLNKKEKLMKNELRQEMKNSFEKYELVRKACEEVEYVEDLISSAMNGVKMSEDAELQMDKLSQHNMETRYADMSRDIQEHLDKANATLKFEKLRSRDLCNMIEAEKKKLQQKEDLFRESMTTKETHRNNLQEEIKWLSREIDAHTQKIVDLNTKL